MFPIKKRKSCAFGGFLYHPETPTSPQEVGPLVKNSEGAVWGGWGGLAVVAVSVVPMFFCCLLKGARYHVERYGIMVSFVTFKGGVLKKKLPPITWICLVGSIFNQKTRPPTPNSKPPTQTTSFIYAEIHHHEKKSTTI